MKEPQPPVHDRPHGERQRQERLEHCPVDARDLELEAQSNRQEQGHRPQQEVHRNDKRPPVADDQFSSAIHVDPIERFCSPANASSSRYASSAEPMWGISRNIQLTRDLGRRIVVAYCSWRKQRFRFTPARSLLDAELMSSSVRQRASAQQRKPIPGNLSTGAL